MAADLNPVVLKNMGVILGKEGDCLRALYYLRRSFEIDPQDPQTVYGFAFAYMVLGDLEQAQKHFLKVLVMEAAEELRGLARDGLRKIAARELKARGPRMDAVFYQLDAMRLFWGKLLEEVREIAFDIGMLGNYGLDINDPKETHVLRSLSGMDAENHTLKAATGIFWLKISSRSPVERRGKQEDQGF